MFPPPLSPSSPPLLPCPTPQSSNAHPVMRSLQWGVLPAGTEAWGHHSEPPLPAGLALLQRRPPAPWAGLPAGRALRLPRCCVPWRHPWPTSGSSPGFHRICELNTTRRQYNKLLFFWKNRFFFSPRPSHHPFRVLMGLQTEIKVSQISALLHNVPDTPFCKQFFFSFFFFVKRTCKHAE